MLSCNGLKFSVVQSICDRKTEPGLWKSHQNQLQWRLSNFEACDFSTNIKNRDLDETRDTSQNHASYSDIDQPSSSR